MSIESQIKLPVLERMFALNIKMDHERRLMPGKTGKLMGGVGNEGREIVYLY